MLLTITAESESADDLGYLLHKHPNRFQTFDISYGKAHVFYPECSSRRCTASLLLELDPVAMVRGRGRKSDQALSQYVNDRPYVASSIMSSAISSIFGSALSGRCKDRPDAVERTMNLTATIDVLQVAGGEKFLHELFEPLGYEVGAVQHTLDTQFPEWGDSPYFSVTLKTNSTVTKLLNHLYVLIPVFDNQKHYFVGQDEIDKLLSKGAGWLATHPAKTTISRRYLRYQQSLVRRALSQLIDETEANGEDEKSASEIALERPISLNDQRHDAVVSALLKSGAKRVVDLGCGEGKLIRRIANESQFTEIMGLDVSVRVLEIAAKRLRIDSLRPNESQRVRLVHGSLMYRDDRITGFDAASIVEVIEHLDPPRLAAFERVVFGSARPKTVIITTPNAEYNVMWESLPAGQLRHADHRFEWTRQEFQSWSSELASRYGYEAEFLDVGPTDENLGPPTQMCVFQIQ